MDKYDIPFLLIDINKNMPKHTDDTVKIKRSYSQGLPKNLMKYSEKVNNKFLNNFLGIIEDSGKYLNLDDFVNYQKKYYYESGILNHDNFFKGKIIDGYLENTKFNSFVINPYYVIPSILYGTEIETDSGTIDSTNSGSGQLEASRCTTFTLNAVYNQIKMSIGTAAGNVRVGVYDNGATTPTTLLSESASLTAVSGYTTNYAITQFNSLATFQWIAHNQSNGSLTWGVWNSPTNSKYLAIAYGAFPNPYGTPSGVNTISKMKITYV